MFCNPQHDITETKHFVGQIFVRDTVDVMKQALLEHGQCNIRPTESGRHTFLVDAPVSVDDDITGLAVISKKKVKIGIHRGLSEAIA